MCGTVGYMAPEQLGSSGIYDQRVDIWALGVVLYAMATSKMPFCSDEMGETNRLVLSSEPDYDCFGFKRCSPSLITLVQGIL